MKRIIIAIAFVIAATSSGLCHDVWSDGQKVDPLTKKLCCSSSDCKPYPLEQTHIDWRGDYTLETGEKIASQRVQPSPDGNVWVCRWGGELQCFFAPPLGY